MQLCFLIRIGLMAVIAAYGLIASRSGAAEPAALSAVRLVSLENPVSTVNVRKLVRKLLHFGEASADDQPIWLGPARARLLWQKTWRWPDSARDHKLPGGLMGGPMLSIDVPFGTQRELVSLETRLCTSRYAYPDRGTTRILLDELADPQNQRQSLEAGLYLNFAFDGLY
jgi:hypothetical protein